MANVRNTVTDTYQGETIQCAEFVTDNILEFFRVCPLNESGDYAFQMVAKSTVNGKRVVVFLHDSYHLFTLTTEWQFYSYVFKDVAIEDGDHMEIMFRDAGTFRIYHSKLEKGNKVTDWSEADYDGRANTDAIKENIYYPGTVYINGGKIMAETVTADKISVNSLEALSANIGGFKIENNNIVAKNVTDVESNNPRIELHKNPANPSTYGHSKYGFPYQEIYQRSLVRTGISSFWPIAMYLQNTNSTFAVHYVTFPEVSSESEVTNETYDDSNAEYDYTTGLSIDRSGNDIYGSISSLKVDAQNPFSVSYIPFVIYASDFLINKNGQNVSFWHQDNLVCGKYTFGSLGSGSSATTPITKPTSQIGSDPIVTATSSNGDCIAYISSISTSGDDTTVTIGVKNKGATSISSVVVSYMIAKHS